MKKQVLSLLLAAAMCLMLLAGCSGEKNPEAGASPEASAEESASPEASAEPAAGPEAILASYPKKDMGGYEFVINTMNDAFVPQNISSPSDEAQMKRNKMLEEYFNIKFRLEKVGDPNQAFNEGKPAILGGDKYCDMLGQTMWVLGAFLTNDLLLDLQTVPTVHLDAGYYDQKVIRAATMNGKTYELGGDLWPAFGWGITFNKRIVDEILTKRQDLQHPYELVRQDQWNLDHYREWTRAVTKDLNGDGVMKNADDRWGHFGPSGDYKTALTAATTLPIIGQNEKGEMVMMLDDPRWPGYLQNCTGLFVNDGTYMEKDQGAQWGNTMPHWLAGRVGFFANGIKGGMINSRDMEDDWGILPMPKIDPRQEHYGAWVDHNIPMIAVTKTCPRPDDVGMVIDAMFNLSTDMLVPAVIDTMASLYLRDEESKEMMKLVMDSSYYDTVYFLRHGIKELNAPTSLMSDVMMGRDEFVSGYESIKGICQDELDRFFRQGSYAEQ